MTDQPTPPPHTSTAPAAPASGGAGLPPDTGGPAVRDAATRQASAQPDPLRAPVTNTSVAGEEDPGAALDMATVNAADVNAADAAARHPAQALPRRP